MSSLMTNVLVIRLTRFILLETIHHVIEKVRYVLQDDNKNGLEKGFNNGPQSRKCTKMIFNQRKNTQRFEQSSSASEKKYDGKSLSCRYGRDRSRY